jgi:DNA-binding response OmpR family regulator
MGTAQTPLARTGVAPTASEAMAALAQRPPHLTIADVGLSQYILLDQLADAPSHAARIPTIALTRLGELEIDILNRHVRVGTSELHLTGLQQKRLYLFAANAGRLLTRDEILNELQGVDFVADSKVVDRHARNLRIMPRND